MTNRKELVQRVASALILGPVILYASIVSSESIYVLGVIAGAIGAVEALRMTVSKSTWVYYPLAIIAQLLAAMACLEHGIIGGFILAPLVGIFAWQMSIAINEPNGRLIGSVLTWVTMATSSIVVLGDSYQPYGTLAWLMLVIWGTDSGAYFVGKIVKGPRLAPKISPGKTWSGFVGGISIGGLTAIVAAHFGLGFPYEWKTFVAGLILAAIGQGGDLLESSLKRHAGVKDSGNLIPGHGGILDRIDGLMAASIVLAIYLRLAGFEVPL